MLRWSRYSNRSYKYSPGLCVVDRKSWSSLGSKPFDKKSFNSVSSLRIRIGTNSFFNDLLIATSKLSRSVVRFARVLTWRFIDGWNSIPSLLPAPFRDVSPGCEFSATFLLTSFSNETNGFEVKKEYILQKNKVKSYDLFTCFSWNFCIAKLLEWNNLIFFFNSDSLISVTTKRITAMRSGEQKILAISMRRWTNSNCKNSSLESQLKKTGSTCKNCFWLQVWPCTD